MSVRSEKIACRASWRDEFSASFPRVSFSTPTPEVVSREHLATLLVSGVDNALQFSAKLLGALFAKGHLNGPSGRPFIESAHDLHELASQQDERAPQYEGDAIE
jgi:hypothetical protein